MWQVLHCAVTTTWVWLKRLGFQLLVAWQLMQLVAATGMCVAFLPVAALPLWQLLPLGAALKVLWSTRALVQLPVVLWQVSHTVWPACTAVFGLLLAWQVAHWLFTLTLLCRRAGVQLAKPALWQVSQLAEAAAATSW